jgi:hypothetical protein
MSIVDFIDDIQKRDFTSAQSTFQDMMQQRMQDALDQQKIVVAGQMFGEPEDEVEDVSDEDIEAAMEADEDEQEEFDFEGDDEEVEDESDDEQ